MGGATIWLVGMMGVGKSAVGRVLAERLGTPFVDTDARIEAEAGLSIREIFARQGEASFRELERGAIEAVAGQPGVVALGGGAACQPGAVARLKATGRIVYLQASPETLAERVGEAHARPLLAGLDAAGRVARLAALLVDREIHYGQADLTVGSDGLDIEATAGAVEAGLRSQKNGSRSQERNES